MACHRVITILSFISTETIKISGNLLKANCNTVRIGKYLSDPFKNSLKQDGASSLFLFNYDLLPRS